MKAIVESVEGSVMLFTQAKVNFQTIGMATPNIEYQYKCLVKFTETIESPKYTIKEAV